MKEGAQAVLASGTLLVWPGDLQGKTQVPQEEVISAIPVGLLSGCAIADSIFQTGFFF